MTTDRDLDKAGALADPQGLTDYQGWPVVSTTIAITNAGDGLSNSMKIGPVEYPVNETVYVVLECIVAKHTHLPIEDAESMKLVQTLRAGVATVVDGALVREVIEAQRAAIQKAKDDAAGQGNLLEADDGGPDDEEPDSQVFRRNHMAGNHAENLVVGCPMCDQEAAAVAAEQQEPATDG